MSPFSLTNLRHRLLTGATALTCVVASASSFGMSPVYLPKTVMVLDLAKNYDLKDGKSYAILQDNLAFQNSLVLAGNDDNIELQDSFDLAQAESNAMSTRRQMLKNVFRSLRRARNQVENALIARQAATRKLLGAEDQVMEEVIDKIGPTSVTLVSGEKVFLGDFFSDETISRTQKLYELFQHFANDISIKDGIVISYNKPVNIESAPPEQATTAQEYLARSGYSIQSLASFMDEARIYGKNKKENVELLDRPDDLQLWFPGMYLNSSETTSEYTFEDFQDDIKKISEWQPIQEQGLQEYELDLKMRSPEYMAFASLPIEDPTFKKLEKMLYKLHLLVEFSEAESAAVTLHLANWLHSAAPEILPGTLREKIMSEAEKFFPGNKKQALEHANILMEEMFEEDLDSFYENIEQAMKSQAKSKYDDMSYSSPDEFKKDQTLYFGSDDLFSNFVKDVILK